MPTPLLEAIVTYQGIPITDGFSLTRSRGIGPDSGSVNLPVEKIEQLEEKGDLVISDGERTLVFPDIWLDEQGTEVVEQDGDGNPVILKVNIRDERWIFQDFGFDDDDAVRDINIVTNSPRRLGEGADIFRKDTIDDGEPYKIIPLIKSILSPFKKSVKYESTKQIPEITNVRWRWNTYSSAIQELLERGGDLKFCLNIDGSISIWAEGDGDEPNVSEQYLNVFLGDRLDIKPEIVWVIGQPIQVDEMVPGWYPVCPADQDYEVKTGELDIKIKKDELIPLFERDAAVYLGTPLASIQNLWKIPRAKFDFDDNPFDRFEGEVIDEEIRIINFAAINAFAEGRMGMDPVIFLNDEGADEVIIQERSKIAKKNWLKLWRIPNHDKEPNWRKLPMMPERCFVSSEIADIKSRSVQYKIEGGKLKKTKVKQLPDQKEATKDFIEELKEESADIQVLMSGLQPDPPANKWQKNNRFIPNFSIASGSPPKIPPVVKDYNSGVIEFQFPLFDVVDEAFDLEGPLFLMDLVSKKMLQRPHVGVRYTYEKQVNGREDYYGFFWKNDGTIGNAHLAYKKDEEEEKSGNETDPAAATGLAKIIKDSSFILCQYIPNGKFIDEYYQERNRTGDPLTGKEGDEEPLDYNLKQLNRKAERIADLIFSQPTVTENKRIEAWGFHDVECNGQISSVQWSSDGDTCKTVYQINNPIPPDGGPTEREKIYDIDISVAIPQVDSVSSRSPHPTTPTTDLMPDDKVHMMFSRTDNIHNDFVTRLAVIGAHQKEGPYHVIASDEGRGLLVGQFDYPRDWAGQWVQHQESNVPNLIIRPKNVVFKAQIVRVEGNRVIVKREQDNIATANRLRLVEPTITPDGGIA